MAVACKDRVDIWAYCLMPNHVHLIAVPRDADALRDCLGWAHQRYTRRINFREGWRGHLWQGRFASYPMQERYLKAVARYIELNPIRARLVARAEDWPWSSAAAHFSGRDDALVRVEPLLDIVHDWRDFMHIETTEEEARLMRRHEHTGRPLGDENFVEHLEKSLLRILKPGKPGPKKGDK